MTTETYEVSIIETLTPSQVFESKESADLIFAKISKEAEKAGSDVSNEDGRQSIRSMARRIASSKVVIDNHGKEMTAEWVRLKKNVDDERKRLWGLMEGLQEKIRAPLTKWEAEEQEKIRKIEAEKAAQEAAKIAAEKAAEEAERKRVQQEMEAIQEQNKILLAEKEKAERAEQEAKNALAQEIERLKKQEEERLAAEQEAKENVEKELQRAVQELEIKEVETSIFKNDNLRDRFDTIKFHLKNIINDDDIVDSVFDAIINNKIPHVKICIN